MQSFKEEQRSIWRTCRKRKKTAFLCHAVKKVVVLNEDGLFTVPYSLETWGLALPWNEYHALPLEGYELRRKIELHFEGRNFAYRFPLIPLGQKNVLAHTILLVKWPDEFLVILFIWWFHRVYFQLPSLTLHQLKCRCSQGHFLRCGFAPA